MTHDHFAEIEARVAVLREQQPRDLYAEARLFGTAHAGWAGLDALYWAAWYAARQTATAMLATAAREAVTADQIEALRDTASLIAYD